jgi:hypothetical protein
MPDFTFHTFHQLLMALKEQHYSFQTFSAFLRNPAPRAIILRHDVDARKYNSLQAANIETSLGIQGTYNFRVVPRSFDTDIIRQIAALGHEIGYHYEDLTMAGGNYQQAIRLFGQNLAKLRQVALIETICMHGSPLSQYDNRELWEKYNYRDFGIIGEPYFDLDFNSVLYLTDTGRRWDGERVNVRDNVTKQRTKNNPARPCNDQCQAGGEQGLKKSGKVESRKAELAEEKKSVVKRMIRGSSDVLPDAIGRTGEDYNELIRFALHSSFDIIKAANEGRLPDRIMLNFHPQRWDDRPWPWIREYVLQNVKNVAKMILILIEHAQFQNLQKKHL